MVRKVTISLPDELATSIDAEASALGVSRSELVQEASAHYLALSLDERAREGLRRRRLDALAEMAAIGAGPEADPRPSLEIIHEGRDFPDAPSWDAPERAAWEESVGYAEWRAGLGLDVHDARL